MMLHLARRNRLIFGLCTRLLESAHCGQVSDSDQGRLYIATETDGTMGTERVTT